jgi:two-component system cell cycle sensor histidine kinase/response regulator CckA
MTKRKTKSPGIPATAELFKRSVDLISDAILLLDAQNKITFINSPTPALLGLPKEGLLGQPIDRILRLEDRSTRSFIANLETPESGSPMDLLGVCGDSLFNVTAFDIQRTEGFNAIDKKAVTALFIQPSNLSLASAPNIHQTIIGQLTIRITHDFNNSLTAILGNAELVQETLELINAEEDNNPDTPAGSAVPINRDVIRKCVEMATIIQKLQDYAQQQPTSRESVDLNSTINETLPISQKILGSRLSLDFVAGDNLPSIVVDTAQLHQLLFTLFDNCKERAGAAQGTVTVATSLETLSEEDASTHPGARPGRHLLLLVSDRGQPLTADSLPHAFDVFTSGDNKPTALRNGLRLATAYALVKQLGAYIYVESDPNEGTHFKVYFPLEPRDAAPDLEQTKQNRRATTTRKRPATAAQLILIAEDQTDIQQTMIRYLSKAGYKITIAADGLDAWSQFQQLNSNGKDLSLVIADLGLPGMDGRTLCKRIRKVNPTMPVLLTSGHVVPLDPSKTTTTDGLPFIQKPFNTVTLLTAITRLLAADDDDKDS